MCFLTIKGQAMDKLGHEVKRIFELARRDGKPAVSMALKCAEELGEMSAALNVKLGYLPEGKISEPLSGEVCDVVNSALAVMAQAYPELDIAGLMELLARGLAAKSDKWESQI